MRPLMRDLVVVTMRPLDEANDRGFDGQDEETKKVKPR